MKHNFYLPGDKQHTEIIDEIIRVDHSGEYGAQKIYQGQILATKYDGSANCEILVRLAIPIQNSSESQIKNLKDALNQLFKYELICGSNTKINIYECANEKIVVEIKNPLFLNLLLFMVFFSICFIVFII